MLDTTGETELTVIKEACLRGVGIDPAESESWGERPFCRIRTVRTVDCEHEVSHEFVGMVVMRSQIPVLAVPCVASSFTDFALHVVVGVGRDIVTIIESGSISESTVDGSGAPM